MRKLLRMMGRGVMIFLWIVKGLLLVIAIGVLVLWPMSRGRIFYLSVEHDAVRPPMPERLSL